MLGLRSGSEVAILRKAGSDGGGLRAAGAGAVCGWTARNWQVFHVFEPLAPRYATDPGEPGDPGWERWVKTWCLDFVSTYEIYWNVPDGPLRFEQAAQPRLRLARAVRAKPRRWLPTTTTMGRTLRRRSMRALRGWPKSGSRRIRCVIMCGCRWAAWRICGCGRASRICPSISTGGCTRITTTETDFSWAYAGLNAVYLLLGLGRALPAATILGRAAGLYGAAQRAAADH